MQSIIFCTSYIKDQHAWQNRYQRWLDYYDNVPIKAVKKILIDDGSPFLPPAALIDNIRHDRCLAAAKDKNLIVRFDDNLGRQNVATYPGWWRSFLHSVTIARNLGVDKIIHIESDAYVLSPRLVDFINDVQSGWHVLWSERYAFPETAIQIICRDQFAHFERFKHQHAALAFGDIAERLLPFSAVERDFKGDRYADFKRNKGFLRSKKFNRLPIFEWEFFCEQIPADADFATQVLPRQQFEFRHAG